MDESQGGPRSRVLVEAAKALEQGTQETWQGPEGAGRTGDVVQPGLLDA